MMGHAWVYEVGSSSNIMGLTWVYEVGSSSILWASSADFITEPLKACRLSLTEF
jgi:hypothetical protein